jgi:PAS domain S-box-containing protein
MTSMTPSDYALGSTHAETERTLRRAQQAEAQLSRLKLAIEAAQLGLWEWDLRTNEVLFSSEWKSLFGYTDHEISSDFSHWQERIHPDDRVRVTGASSVFLGNVGPTARVEYRVRHRDGGYRWVFSQGLIERDAQGKATRVLGSDMDISAKKRAELEHQEREALLALCIENCPAPIAMLDRDLRYLAASRRWLIDLRLGPSIIGRRHYDVFPELPERWKQILGRCLAGAIERCEEDCFTRLDGSVDWVRWEVRPWHDALGGIGGIIIFSELINERKQAEQALERSEQRLRSVFEHAPIGIFQRDAQGKLLYMNPALEKLFAGVPVCELDNDWACLVHPDDRARVLAFRQELVSGSVSRNDYTARLVLESGETRRVHVQASAIRRNGKVEAIVGTLDDISERMRLQDELVQAQKMEAVGQLAGGIAHDFNNLLTVIMNAVELVQQTVPPAQRALLEHATAASERAATLTKHLMTFGRKQRTALRPVELNALVASHCTMLRRMLGEQTELHMKPDASAAPVEADANLIEQLLMNLVMNARDAMPEGGTITIGIDTAVANPPQQQGSAPQVCVRLSVKDTGTGIGAEHLPHIFEPFYTTKKKGKGSGLGLAAVYGIAEQHRGWVEVDSQPGLGTTLSIYLPRASVAPSAMTEPPALTPDAHGEGILLVEDETAVRQMVRMSLEHCGYRVFEAATGDEALGVWSAHKQDIELLLSDVVMPGKLSGPALARQLRAEANQLKVVFMSGYCGQELDNEPDSVLVRKPFLLATLANTVCARLGRAN